MEAESRAAASAKEGLARKLREAEVMSYPVLPKPTVSLNPIRCST